jgi:Na+/H+ antiporter NhaA
MRYPKLAIVILVWSALSSPALAQQPSGSGGRTVLWTSVGAGTGFGLGLFAGLTAFDDAINSDRKVWTSAIVGAAAGGTLGYLISRARRHSTPSRQAIGAGLPRPQMVATPPLTDRDVVALASSTRLRH